MVEPKKEEAKTAPQADGKAAPAPEGALEARIRALEAENAQLRSAAPTHMVKPPKISRPVKIRAMCPIRIPAGTMEDGKPHFAVIEPGAEATVDEETAAEYCDKAFVGNYNFGGERTTATATRHVVKRAVRVA